MRQQNFKQYGRSARQAIVEEQYAGGMQATNIPLSEGNCRTLVNFDFKDDGRILTPRGGFTPKTSAFEVGRETLPLVCLHAGRTQCTYLDNTDSLRRYMLFYKESVDKTQVGIADLRALLDIGLASDIPDFQALTITGDAGLSIRTTAMPTNARMHYMPVRNPARRPLSAVLNNKTYYIGLHADGNSIVKAELSEQATGYQLGLTQLTPREVTPTEAINYGYNMLKASPYAFSDAATAAMVDGQIRLQGILPYTNPTCTQLLFNAKVGTPVTFRLIADFPQNETSEYKFKWELRDLQSDAITVYDEPTATSVAYHFVFDHDGEGADLETGHAVGDDASDFITLQIQPPYRQFSITVTAYAAADLTEPVDVLVLGSYSLTADNASTTNQIDVKNYDPTTATGMCTWAQRVVLWGVQGGKNILFVSDVNDPSYFPYPNNAEVYLEEIIACIPYMSDLLVFTETQILLVKWEADGLSYKSTVVQDRLSLTEFDIQSIVTVKNMVFFKNGNYFYMIVPSLNTATKGELVLAPVSKPITNLLDTFEAELTLTFDNMHNLSKLAHLRAQERLQLRLNDFHNYLDRDEIRNVYNFTAWATLDGVPVRPVCTFDYMLNYNSMLRIWNSYVVQTNGDFMLPYRQTITDMTYYAHAAHDLETVTELYDDGSTAEVQYYDTTFQLAQFDPLTAKDTILEFPMLKNWQYLDSGHREHNSSNKKRYRELQFKINNIEQSVLEFGIGFFIDDDTRKSMFKYTPVVYTTDPNDPMFGWVYMERDFTDAVATPGATVLDDEDDPDVPITPIALTMGDLLESNRWVLDYSQLSSAIIATIRVPVSGKGYAPRLQLLSFNEKRYELLNLNWVYRNMNMR